jgi:hypothetical protein
MYDSVPLVAVAEAGSSRTLHDALDDIGVTMTHEAAILEYEHGRRAQEPWLFWDAVLFDQSQA